MVWYNTIPYHMVPYTETEFIGNRHGPRPAPRKRRAKKQRGPARSPPAPPGNFLGSWCLSELCENSSPLFLLSFVASFGDAPSSSFSSWLFCLFPYGERFHIDMTFISTKTSKKKQMLHSRERRLAENKLP